MSRSIFIAAALALAVTLPAISAAQAQAPRTFVSAAGTDNSTCSFAAPCRHFQAAVMATSAGGEVDALDPAGYGPITISQAITIEGQGWSYIAPPANGNGITINAVSGNVVIHGVSLNGAGITGGTNGIVFNSGSRLTVTDCVAQNFTSSVAGAGNGILIQPTSGAVRFNISNTTLSSNDEGISYIPPSGSPTTNGVIDHVAAINNVVGIVVSVTTTAGGSATITIANSDVSNDSINGISIDSSTVQTRVSIDNVTAASNGTGIMALGNPNVLVGRSVITNNGTGVQNSTSPNNFYTYQDNRIDFNSPDTTGSVLLQKSVQ